MSPFILARVRDAKRDLTTVSIRDWPGRIIFHHNPRGQTENCLPHMFSVQAAQRTWEEPLANPFAYMRLTVIELDTFISR